jgi:hypothetical protein
MENIDFNRPKTPCENQSLGCPVPNWHICLIGKEDRTHEFPDLLMAHIPGQRRYMPSSLGRAVHGSAEHIAKVRATQQANWAAHNASNEARNKRMVADYESGLGLREIREKYHVGQGTAIKVLHAARDRGELVMRQRGFMEYGVKKMKAV